MGSGSAVFLGIRDQAVPYLWDQGRKLVTLLESIKRITNLRTKMGSAMKKHTSLPPCYVEVKLSVNINSQTVRIFRCYCHLFCLS